MLSLDECRRFTAGEWLIEPEPQEVMVSIESDSRKDCSSALFVAFEGERFDAHDFLVDVVAAGVQALCVHKKPSAEILQQAADSGVGVLLVDDTVKAYQDLATGKLQKSSCKVIGITGSSGKTSVKSILSQMLEVVAPGKVLSTLANTNNHIGVPQNLLRLTDEHEFAVIEMGTNNPGEIAVLAKCASPDIAIITSIGDSHGGNFPENGILYEKSDIVKFMKEGALAVIPAPLKEDISSTGVLEGRDFLTFGTSSADIEVEYVESQLHGSEIKVLNNMSEAVTIQCSLSGRHQASNIAACCAVMKSLGYELSSYIDCFSNLELPGMRMKIIEQQAVTWVNDAYNANPQSMAAFITWLGEIADLQKKYKNLYLVLGDMLELGDKSLLFHQQILKSLPENWQVIVVGENFTAAAAGNFLAFAESVEAAKYLVGKLEPGDFVALKGSRGIGLEKIYKKYEEED